MKKTDRLVKDSTTEAM